MGASYTPLPERPRRYRFALTPLADAMFQLLIFFMLSSSLTPYSLVTLRSTTDAAKESAAEPSGAVDETAQTPAPSNTGPQVTIWSLGNATLTVDGQVFNITQLPELAEALGTQDAPGNVVILVTDEARVQDVASALEALNAAEVEAVQLARTQP